MRTAGLFWGCWVGIYNAYQVNSVGLSEVGGNLTPKAALFPALLRPQVSNRPMKVTDSAPGQGKAVGCALLGLFGGYS